MDGSMMSPEGPYRYPPVVLGLTDNMLYYDYDTKIWYLLEVCIQHEHTLRWIYPDHVFWWWSNYATCMLPSIRFRSIHSNDTLISHWLWLGPFGHTSVWWCGQRFSKFVLKFPMDDESSIFQFGNIFYSYFLISKL